MKKVVVILFVFFALIFATTFWGMTQIQGYVNSPLKIEKTSLITIDEGENYTSLTRKLVSDGLIASNQWAKIAGRIVPDFSKLQAGTYEVEPNTSLIELFRLSFSGKEHLFSVTFVEGTTFNQWLEQLKTLPYLKQTLDTMSEKQIASVLELDYEKLEGLFLPETYYYNAGESDLALLRRAAQALEKVLNEAWENRKQKLPLKSKYELLTLASIIEKETGVAKERKIVSSVFINRLKKNMRLQTDPTVIYGMGEAYKGNITKKDLQKPTPYNTYVIRGLPPSPIAMAGKAAIVAAALPDNTPYYYFVAKGDGGHQFSKTLKAHNRAVRAYLNYLKKNK